MTYDPAEMLRAIIFERRNPLTEAIRFTGTKENIKAIENFYGGVLKVKVKHTITQHWSDDTGSIHHSLRIEFLDQDNAPERPLALETGDWVVRSTEFGRVGIYSMTNEHFQKEFRPKENT